jgi:hypothetical protein
MGRVFANCEIVYFGQFLKIAEADQIFGLFLAVIAMQ